MPRGDEDEMVARCAPLPVFGDALPGERLLVGLIAGRLVGLLASERFLGELFFGELFFCELLAGAFLAAAFLAVVFLAGRNFLE